MAKNYVTEGRILDYTNAGAAIASGDVVIVAGLLGVALVDIATGATGSVQIDGVFSLPCAAATVIAQGDDLDWDVSAGQLDKIGTPAAGDVSNGAIAYAGAGAGVTTVKAKLNVRGGTVT